MFKLIIQFTSKIVLVIFFFFLFISCSKSLEYKESTQNQDYIANNDFTQDLSNQKPETFNPSSECQSCHAQEYLAWKKSPHANSFKPPSDLAEETLPKCLRCHTTGYNTPYGYLDDAKTSDLACITCDACHNLLPFRKSCPKHPDLAQTNIPCRECELKKVCLHCHHNAHGKVFDFSKALQKLSNWHK